MKIEHFLIPDLFVEVDIFLYRLDLIYKTWTSYLYGIFGLTRQNILGCWS